MNQCTCPSNPYMLPWRIVDEAVKKYYDVKSDDNESEDNGSEC